MKSLNAEENEFAVRLAPLIDVVFLLLIFFLVATTFYEAEKDITIRLAEAAQGQEREKSPRILVVNVRQSGVLVMNERVRTLDELGSDLRQAKQVNPDVVVVVRCDRNAFHKHFVRVLNLCEQVGVSSVAVATLQSESGDES